MIESKIYELSEKLGLPERKVEYAYVAWEKNNEIKMKKIAKGNKRKVAVRFQKIIDFAEKSNVRNIYIVHNHLDNPKPSDLDLMAFELMKNDFEDYGINLKDIIIIGRNGYGLASNQKVTPVIDLGQR